MLTDFSKTLRSVFTLYNIAPILFFVKRESSRICRKEQTFLGNASNVFQKEDHEGAKDEKKQNDD